MLYACLMYQDIKTMSYANIFYLKFLTGLSTLQLEQLFPGEKHKICVVALCSLPDQTLQPLLDKVTLQRVRKIREACFRRWRAQAL